MKKLLILLLALMVLAPQAAFANKAEILLLPTRIVMEKGDRFATVIIRNIGNATGNLSVDLIDMKMDETGNVLEIPGGQDPYSAIPYLRLSPKSMSLKPGEAQNVRLMLRKPEVLAPGEYRSHLKVKIEDDNVEETDKVAANPTKEAHIEVKAKIAFTIPVIFRNGETMISVKMDSPKIIRDAKGKPSVSMTLIREGNRSVMGDFTFTYTPPGGAPKLIKTFPGIPVYRGTDRRSVTIAMDDIPKDVDLSKGKLDIVYTAQEKEGGMKLAEGTIDLSAR